MCWLVLSSSWLLWLFLVSLCYVNREEFSGCYKCWDAKSMFFCARYQSLSSPFVGDLAHQILHVLLLGHHVKDKLAHTIVLGLIFALALLCGVLASRFCLVGVCGNANLFCGWKLRPAHFTVIPWNLSSAPSRSCNRVRQSPCKVILLLWSLSSPEGTFGQDHRLWCRHGRAIKLLWGCDVLCRDCLLQRSASGGSLLWLTEAKGWAIQCTFWKMLLFLEIQSVKKPT